MQVVIYKQDNGRVAIVRPTVQALMEFGIEAIASKDVPAGKPFKIIDAALVPAERAARDAWQVEDAELTDGVGTGAWPL
jgi:hypothetical protein